MRKSAEVVIGAAVGLAAAAAAAYFAIGYAIYKRLADVRGDCDPHR
jgi:hypothetical protein